ncbi:Stk1 family PASTA domain-containing Ser/Thr kinase [Metabacillus sp. RGM 3146]|uniref:Stk1 family PASTA domain-containing Ser/Thr kinase n=1 Tax=Metabacillus sp. RGM 3146 TaxID=3401092 RepID=UPI003B9C8E2E
MLIGKRINGRYRVLEVVGGGGMANVYLAKDMILEREVALKVLRFDFANDEDFIRRFRREAQSATSLAHPNIVSIYDVGEEDSIYYIVMEYVEGTTLKQYIQQHGPLHPREALNIMEQVVSAIACAHENQIVHRDIKPHNILIDPHGNVKVTDFGIAMALSSTTITHTNSVLGSVHYLSPEQARGGLATKKSDVYSLGIVLFELLTGRVPFDGESAVSIALKHLQSETPSARRWNHNIPQSVENIILKAMAKDPFNRFESAEEMEEDIRTAFNPGRLNEPRYSIPNDGEEATKAIPIITDPLITNEKGDTIVHKFQPFPQNGAAEAKDAKPEKKKKKRNKFATFIVVMFIILVLAAVAAFTVVPSLMTPGDKKVPDVKGKEYAEAANLLLESGFKVKDPESISSDDIPEGKVVKTDPQSGEYEKDGAAITIYQSTGKQKTPMEDYSGQNIDTVQALLEKKDFKKIKVTEVYDDQVEGTIIEQNPSSGTLVIPEDDEITFTVSKGPEKIKLKDLAGYSREAVYSYREDAKFSLKESEKYSDTVPKDQIISQSPKAGAMLEQGDQVEVVFSLGPEEKPVKTVKKDVEIPYEPVNWGEDVTVQIAINDEGHSIDQTYATYVINQPETKKIEFKIAPGSSAYYQIVSNNKVLKSESIPYPE